jgi:hypothetical protein
MSPLGVILAKITSSVMILFLSVLLLKILIDVGYFLADKFEKEKKK